MAGIMGFLPCLVLSQKGNPKFCKRKIIRRIAYAHIQLHNEN